MRFDGPSAEVATARRLDWVHSVEVGRTGRERGVRPQPIRMCIGCRQRGVKTDLLRVVLVREAATQWLLPDLSGSAPGRGAHLHPTTDCFAVAERRRAFARALRVEGMVDVSPLRRYVEHGPEQGVDEPSGTEQDSTN